VADTVAEIKARLDIVEVVSGYVQLQRSGRQHKGLCPFHAEKTPSFSVSQERQAWYCFGCQEGGDVFSFVERIERIDFREALERLADRAGVELERLGRDSGQATGKRRRRTLELNTRAQAYFAHVLWSTAAGASGRALLEERGVPELTARHFGIGFAPAGGNSGDALVRYLSSKAGGSVDEIVSAGLAHPGRGGLPRDRFRHRLMFPIRDERGTTIAFGARALGDATPKYLNSPETSAYRKSAALFGIDLARDAIAQSSIAVIVEGYFDVIAAHAAGVDNVVASSGTSLTREQVRYLARHAHTLTLCFDFDDAGRAATSRAVDVVAAEGLQARICTTADGAKDPDELVRRDPAAFAALVASAPPEWQVLLDRALDDAEGGSVDARRSAAERAVTLLVRIPEATTRELYAQQTARRLSIGTASLLADLNRALREGSGRPARVVMQQPAAQPLDARAADEPSAAADEPPVPAWELHLGAFIVNRPSLARTLVDTMGLNITELTTSSVRRLIEAAADVPDGGSFPLHRLAPAEQRLAAALLMRDVPELADDAVSATLQRALADCVRYVQEAGVQRSLAAIQHELDRAKEEGRDDDMQALAGRLLELAAATPRLRRTLTAR
jgi:DNA primase